MNHYYISMLITVAANAGYHICQKSISSHIHPLVSMIITYGVALVASLIALPFVVSGSNDVTLLHQLKIANWATYGLGFAAVGLELGFLLAYRSGWPVSLAALFSNATVALILIPMGLVFFREHLDLTKVIGLVTTVVGLWLLKK